jgi:hypothetical protein
MATRGLSTWKIGPSAHEHGHGCDRVRVSGRANGRVHDHARGGRGHGRVHGRDDHAHSSLYGYGCGYGYDCGYGRDRACGRGHDHGRDRGHDGRESATRRLGDRSRCPRSRARASLATCLLRVSSWYCASTMVRDGSRAFVAADRNSLCSGTCSAACGLVHLGRGSGCSDGVLSQSDSESWFAANAQKSVNVRDCDCGHGYGRGRAADSAGRRRPSRVRGVVDAGSSFAGGEGRANATRRGSQSIPHWHMCW